MTIDVVDRHPSPTAGLGMYVHIPYCRRRCNYCDFAIVPVGEGRAGGGDAGGSGSGGGGGGGGFVDVNRRYREAVLDKIEALGGWRILNLGNNVVFDVKVINHL